MNTLPSKFDLPKSNTDEMDSAANSGNSLPHETEHHDGELVLPEERAKIAYELRLSGKSIAEISAELHCSDRTTHRLLQQHRQKYIEMLAQPIGNALADEIAYFKSIAARCFDRANSAKSDSAEQKWLTLAMRHQQAAVDLQLAVGSLPRDATRVEIARSNDPVEVRRKPDHEMSLDELKKDMVEILKRTRKFPTS